MYPLGCRGAAVYALVAGAAVSVCADPARATDRFWINSAGGVYNDTSNWLDGLAPNHTGIANFDIAGVFTVVFPGNASVLRYRQRAGDITFDFGGMVYSAVATSPSSESNAAIGRLSGDNATMRLTNGRFDSMRSSIGEGAGSIGRVVAVGDGGGIIGAPRWYGSGTLFVGDAGNGTLEVTNSALVRHDTIQIGYLAGSTGTVIVTGAGSELFSAPDFFSFKPIWVGVNGLGHLEVNAGATVRSTDLSIAGNASSSTSTMIVDGGRVYPTTITCGWSGKGEMEILADGLVQPSSTTHIGRFATGEGVVRVSGTNARLLSMSGIFVGTQGKGDVLIENGGRIAHNASGAGGSIADAVGSTGSVMVRGANSLWNGWMQLVYVGRRGQGDFTALDAGQVSSGAVYVGHEDGSVGGVTLAGAGTLWEASNVFVVGLGGEGALLVESEAALIATQLQIGLQSTAFGEATIVGDAAVTLSSGAGNAIQVGAGSGWGTLRIQKGSVVQAPGGASIGSSGGNGQVQVEGAGSLLSLGQNLVLGGFSGASAHLSVFDAGEAVCRAMFLYTDSTAHLTGVGTKLSTQVGGVGVGASTESGHLVVDNAAELITQTVTVYPGSTLQGRLGLITGAVSNRGELYPGMQTMTGADQISSFFIDGSFTQLSDGALHIDLNDLGAGPANDVLQVSGTAVIDGALVVSIVDNPPPAAMRSTFNPPLNTEYEVLTAASVSGAFASESLPALAGNRYLEVEYEAGRVLLVVRSTCPADLNNDNSVNGADLGLLLGEWGSAGGQADLSDDGTVNGADLGLLLGAWGACP